MKLVIMGGLAASLAMAVVAQGWAAGMGQWLAALMVTGVAVVSLAGSYPTLARRLGVLGGAAALSLAIADWTLSG